MVSQQAWLMMPAGLQGCWLHVLLPLLHGSAPGVGAGWVTGGAISGMAPMGSPLHSAGGSKPHTSESC